MDKAILNWSGGKDCSMALLQSRNMFDIRYLFTSVNGVHQRISMHGVRVELLEQQAAHIGIPLKQLVLPETPSMEEYNTYMQQQMQVLTQEGITHSIFGDIFLEDLRKYREEQLQQVNMKGVFPLWKQDTKTLLTQFIDLGFKAVIVCVNEKHLDKSFAGRILDADFVNDLPPNVDPCGEHGEFHTFVFDGPIFTRPIKYTLGDIVHRTYKPVSNNKEDNCFSNDPQPYDTGFWYADLLPV